MKKYWIIVEGKPQGPFTAEQMQMRADFTAQLPVWTTGMTDWTTAGQVEELAQLLTLHENHENEPQPVGDYVEETVEQEQQPQPRQQPVQQQWINPLLEEINGEKRPATYLGWNIAMTICCCLPGGIAGIIFSTMVNQRWLRGDVEGAKKASEYAAWCLILSIVLGLVCWPFQMIFQLL